MAGATFDYVRKQYTPDLVVIDDIDVEIMDKEFMVLMGPSSSVLGLEPRQLEPEREVVVDRHVRV